MKRHNHPHVQVAVMALKHVSSLTVLMIAAAILAFGIHSAFAAPDGPPTNPALNVIPNFDGLNITDGGKINAKNTSDVIRAQIDGQEGVIFLKDTPGTTDVVTLDPNSALVAIDASGAKFSVRGDNGISQWQDDSLTMTHSGSQKVNINAGANSGEVGVYSAFGVTKPYVRMSADGTTSKVELNGGSVDASQISNTSTEALGDVYLNDNVRVGSAYTLKADNITGSTSDWVFGKSFYADTLTGDSITASTSIGRYYEKNTYGSNTITAGGNKVVITSCDPGDYVIACAGQLDVTAPYDIDYRGAWKTSQTQCSAAFSNKKGTDYTGSMGGSAYCFSPNG